MPGRCAMGTSFVQRRTPGSCWVSPTTRHNDSRAMPASGTSISIDSRTGCTHGVLRWPMGDPADARSVEILHKLGLTEGMVRDHVFRPDHVTAAALRVELREPGDDPADGPPPSGWFYRLNV